MPLLDLPTEILQEIIEHLKQRDLYSVIRVNRRLHFLFSEYLLRYNVRHRNGRALLWAVIKGHESTARKLVELGADVNRQIALRGHKFSLLRIAAQMRNLPMIKVLLESGADLNQRDDKGRAPHYWALRSRNEKIIQEFSWRTENLSRFVVDAPQNHTSLHLAASFGLTGLIRYFVDEGMDVDAKDKYNQTPLDLAKTALLEGRWGRISDIKDDNTVEMMRLLVVLGEDPATANWFVTCNAEAGRRRYSCNYGDLGYRSTDFEIETPEFRSDLIMYMLSGYKLTNVRSSAEHDTDPICLSSVASTNPAFPPLVDPKTDTDSKPETANGPWSTAGAQHLKTKLSSNDEVRDTSMSGPASPEPFPRLPNHGVDKEHDEAINAWTRFREGEGEPMDVNARMATRDGTGDADSALKSVKPRGKKKWQPIAGLY